MTDERIDLPNTDKKIAASGYNLGFGTNEEDWQELNVDAFTEAYERIGGLEARPGIPYRLLSSFDTLQAACDWSSSTPGSVYVDGQFRTDETGVNIANAVSFVGGPASDLRNIIYPSIICTSTTGDTPFFQYSQKSTTIHLQNVNFLNEGSPRAFIEKVPGSDPWLNYGTDWSNVTIDKFGSTGNHPYTVSLESGYAITMDNVTVRNIDTPAYGMWRLTNCNACAFRGLQAVNNTAQDGETPAVYLFACHALHLDSPHIENLDTDAALQITRGNVTVTNLYLEGHSDPGLNAGVQIGDGGVADGNTTGTWHGGEVTIIEPVNHNISTQAGKPTENIRVLNADATKIIGGSRRDTSTLNYGGSNHDAQSDLSTDPGPVSIIGNTDIEVTNSTSDVASVVIDNGRVFRDEADADAGLVSFEWGWVSDATGVAIVRKDESGTLSVWRPVGSPAPTETVIGPITTDYSASHDDVVFVNSANGNVTVTLPAAAEGLRVTTVNAESSGSGGLIVETADGADVNDVQSVTVTARLESREWVCDGTRWWAV